MSPFLSISVMAHESRAEYFPYLREKLGNAPIVVDVKGVRNVGVWGNCQRAWQLYDKGARYHCVIQDDAIICDNFRERAEAFIRKYERPHEVRAFNFYFGNKQRTKALAEAALQAGKDYVVKKIPSWGVAICLPTSLIPSMLATCDQMKNPQDDVRIGKFIVKRDIPVYFPMPSLVSHRTGMVSLVGDPGKGRKALYYVDDLSIHG